MVLLLHKCNRRPNFFLLILVISFLKFSKAAKQETSTISDTKRHYCCARHQKMIVVGHGIMGEEIKIDAGYCKSFCPRFFLDDSGDVSRPAVQKCTSNMFCRVRATRIERVSTIEGVRSVEVVDTCDCTKAHVCRREAYFQTLYVGTPYQVEIDTGACVGTCSSSSSASTPDLKNRSCRPSRNSSMSIRGPNGDEVHEIIERCACVGSCHRMDRIETVLDFSRVEVEENKNIADAVPTLRHINVGQCVGSCVTNGSHPTSSEMCTRSQMMLWNAGMKPKTSLIKCLPGLFSGSHVKCTPAKFKIHEYRTRRGYKREIIQITQCACV